MRGTWTLYRGALFTFRTELRLLERLRLGDLDLFLGGGERDRLRGGGVRLCFSGRGRSRWSKRLKTRGIKRILGEYV